MHEFGYVRRTLVRWHVDVIGPFTHQPSALLKQVSALVSFFDRVAYRMARGDLAYLVWVAGLFLCPIVRDETHALSVSLP